MSTSIAVSCVGGRGGGEEGARHDFLVESCGFVLCWTADRLGHAHVIVQYGVCFVWYTRDGCSSG